MTMNKIIIGNAVRTGGGRFEGNFKETTAVELGAAVIKEAIKRINIPQKEVDEVIFGNGWQAGIGPNPARLCVVESGLSIKIPAFSVNIRCGSSLRAVQFEPPPLYRKPR